MALASNIQSRGGVSDDVALPQCLDCLQRFVTRCVLSLHWRSAHPEEYHLKNVPKERKKAHWEHEELVLLMEREMDTLAAGGKVNVNKYLAEASLDRTLEAIKRVRKRPAYKELVTTLSTSTHDSRSSLPSEGPSLVQQVSSEEWTQDWAADLIRVVRESGNVLDRLWLEDIEPGKPSDWVREAVDSNYEAWLTAPTVVGQYQRASAPLGEPKGLQAKRRSQYARVQQRYDMDHTCCAQEIIAPLYTTPSRSHFGAIFQRPHQSLTLGRLPLLEMCTGSCYILLHMRMS